MPETTNYVLQQQWEQQITMQKEPVGLHGITVLAAGRKQQNEMSAQANPFPFGSLLWYRSLYSWLLSISVTQIPCPKSF